VVKQTGKKWQTKVAKFDLEMSFEREIRRSKTAVRMKKWEAERR